jgi:flagellar biosynthetic protein FliR
MADLAPQQIFVFLAVFTRLSAMIMLFPALGEISVSPRIRLTIALGICLVISPLVAAAYPVIPQTVFGLATIIGQEVFIGIVIGGATRLVMSTLQVAGTVIAFQTSLGFAQNVDPSQGIQSALVGTFMSIVGVTLIFTLDLHHMMIGAMHDSYILFAPGHVPDIGDFSAMALDTVALSFSLAIRIASPFVAFGLVFYLGIGVLSKLMPQVQIFFIAMPANILLGFAILMLVINAAMIWFMEHFEQTLSKFLAS